MKKTIFVVFLMVASACGTASAQMRSGQHMMGGQGYYGENQESPYGMGYGWGYHQLDKKQQEAYSAIMEKYGESLGKLTEKIWAKRALLNAELAQEKIDRKKVTSLAEELGKMMADACVQHTQMQIEMREQGIPYTGMGMMHGGMMGYGMMGRGMGYGMMGPGMMGGSGHMMGHGGMW